MKYFKLSEFETNGVKITNQDIIYNITNLVDTLLDKVREYYGKAIYVVDGYNPNSKHEGHTIGVSADITTKSKQGNIDIFEFIKTLTFDELSVNGDYESIHVSIYPKNRETVTESITDKEFESNYLVCIDSGHGKDTPGKRSPDGRLLEWAWNREIKYRLIEKLENNRVAKCFDVNPEDTEPGLTTRANRANKACETSKQKGIFVSIHVNAAGNGEWTNARGWSIWSTKGFTESDNLAEVMWEEANKIFPDSGAKMRSDLSDGDHDYESNFTVIYKANMPAVLVENHFMDSRQDVEYLLSEKGKEDCVQAMYNGIKRYLESKK